MRSSLRCSSITRISRHHQCQINIADGLMPLWMTLMDRHNISYRKPSHSQWTSTTSHCNGRLLTMEDDRIAFRYKDYRDHSRLKTQWLDGQEFVRRFLMHILPKGFMRIRHFGYLSSCIRRRKLAVIRHCLAQPPKPEVTLGNPASQRCWSCLLCNNGLVRMIRQIPRFRPAVIPTS